MRLKAKQFRPKKQTTRNDRQRNNKVGKTEPARGAKAQRENRPRVRKGLLHAHR